MLILNKSVSVHSSWLKKGRGAVKIVRLENFDATVNYELLNCEQSRFLPFTHRQNVI